MAAQSSRTWANAMEGLKPYRNDGCSFIHDDRGRFCPVGDVAWLQPIRAKKIIEEGAARGIQGAISPIEDPTDLGIGRGSQSPLSVSKPPAGSLSSDRDDLVARFLSLHHSRRKKLAKLLGAKGRIKASQADKFIRSADLETLEQHQRFLEGE